MLIGILSATVKLEYDNKTSHLFLNTYTRIYKVSFLNFITFGDSWKVNYVTVAQTFLFF